MPRIYPGLEKIHDDYCVIGSAALALSGIDIDVHDLDILTSHESAAMLKALWADTILTYRPPNYATTYAKASVVKKASSGKQEPPRFRSEFGRFGFEEMPLEVMGNLEVNRDGSWVPVTVMKPHTINLGGRKLRIPTLEEQKRIFLLLGREKDLEKVRLIDKMTLKPTR